ncbi:MAG: hypothetical protein ACR2P2_16005 [Nakamurella sp.]
MWRAAWRQHRSWVSWILAVAAAGAIVLAATVAFVPACASTAWWETPGATCSYEPAKTLWKLFRLGMLTLPILSGVLLGAMTFGPDAEHRTQTYALTQGVSRLRWWAVKVVTTSAPVFLALALLGLATLLVVDASDNAVTSTNRLMTNGFDVLGLTPATRFLVAYAAAAAAALVWRTVGGVVAGLVVAGVVLAVGAVLQPLVVPHDRDLVPIKAWVADDTGTLTDRPGSAYGWGGYADSAGREVDISNLDCGQADFSGCLLTANVSYRLETYVSDSQYPRMMFTISGFNVLIAGAFLGLGARVLRRRDL